MEGQAGPGEARALGELSFCAHARGAVPRRFFSALWLARGFPALLCRVCVRKCFADFLWKLGALHREFVAMTSYGYGASVSATLLSVRTFPGVGCWGRAVV